MSAELENWSLDPAQWVVETRKSAGHQLRSIRCRDKGRENNRHKSYIVTTVWKPYIENIVYVQLNAHDVVTTGHPRRNSYKLSEIGKYNSGDRRELSKNDVVNDDSKAVRVHVLSREEWVVRITVDQGLNLRNGPKLGGGRRERNEPCRKRYQRVNTLNVR